MRMPFAYRSIRGQTSLEYLLLLAVVAVIVIASFGPGSLVSQVHDAAQGYYNTVTSVIMGNGNETIDGKQIAPINGGWCPVTSPPVGSFGPTVMYRSCECPAPAFGGAYCQGSSAVTTGATACGPCSTGQVCGAAPITTQNPSGCGCPNNGLTVSKCSSALPGSIVSPDCSQCICPYGWHFDQSAHPPACINYCPDPCTTFSNGTCVAVMCGQNMHCDSSKLASCECQCDQYSYWNGSGCVYCKADSNGNCTQPVTTGGSGPCNTGATTTCQALTGPGSGGCPNNMWCNGAINSCQCDYSPSNNFCTYWNGTACAQGSCGCQPTGNNACPTSNGVSLSNSCGTDSCGSPCGANGGECCPPGQNCGQTCSSTTPGTPGTCVSSCGPTGASCQTWNGSACVSTTPCGSNTCGFDSCGNACGSNQGGCPSGEPCSSSSAVLPGLCCQPCQTLQNGACVNNTTCGGNNNCGTDSCGNNCGTCPPAGQPTLTKCSSATTPGQCVPN